MANLFKNKIFIISVSFLLVLGLAVGIFVTEYVSVLNDYKAVNSELKQTKDEKAVLESENASNKAYADEQTKKNDELNSKVDKLESEISQIKLTKSQMSGGKNTATSTKIDMSLLTASNTGYKVCYLTFDDGPSDNTLKILDILKQANAKASFFVVGTSKLEYIKRIHAEGHTVALHANNHDYSKIYKSEDAYFKDLTAISNKVEKSIGIAPKIIRFPGGSSNAVSKKYSKGIMTRLTKKVEEKGYVYVDWNVDSTDASAGKVAESKLIKSIQSNSKNKGDICVLMHDTGAKTTTVDALPEIICHLRGQGYRFEALTTESTVFHHGLNN